MILLETDRLRLRRFASDDIDRLVELDSDPEVMRYLTWGEPSPREWYVDEVMPRWLARYEATPQLGHFAAEDRATGEFLGWFHLHPDRFEPDEQELGYRLRRACWGRGLATEGSKALLVHGFGVVGADKVCARTLATNLGSQRVMQKAGLRYECAFVYPLEIIPDRTEAERASVKYSITRAEWRASRA
jgi:RimJ/RimL family protein N-acetyltransferase